MTVAKINGDQYSNSLRIPRTQSMLKFLLPERWNLIITHYFGCHHIWYRLYLLYVLRYWKQFKTRKMKSAVLSGANYNMRSNNWSRDICLASHRKVLLKKFSEVEQTRGSEKKLHCTFWSTCNVWLAVFAHVMPIPQNTLKWLSGAKNFFRARSGINSSCRNI